MDLVEAPPPVLAYYCAHQHLHDIPVSLTKLTTQKLNGFKSSHPEIQRFYTDDQLVRYCYLLFCQKIGSETPLIFTIFSDTY